MRATAVRRLLFVAISVAVLVTAPAADADPTRFGTTTIASGVADLALPIEAPREGDRFGPGDLLFLDAPPGYGNSLCTAGFALSDGTHAYLTTAGHCALPQKATATHGVDADQDPSGWRVLVCVESCSTNGELGTLGGRFIELGPVVYARQGDPTRATGDDFAVIAVPDELTEQLDPSLAAFGGPTDDAWPLPVGPVCTHGWSTGFGEVPLTRPRASVLVAHDDRMFSTLLPAYNGDSGSPVVACGPSRDGLVAGGAAIGILTHVTPEDFTAGTTLRRGLELARRDADLALSLLTPGGRNGQGPCADPPECGRNPRPGTPPESPPGSPPTH